jgi:hypothetical protein
MPGTPVKRLRNLLTDEDGLTPAEQKFVSRYLIHSDAIRAMREAFGDTRHNSKKLLTKPEIVAVLRRELAARKERYTLQADWVLAELAMLIRTRWRDFFYEDGTPIPVHLLSDEADAALASIDFEDKFEWDEDDSGKKVRKKSGEIIKYRRYSKTEALALALRNLGIDHAPSAEGRDRLKEMMVVFQAGPVPRQIEGETTEKK